MEKRVKIVSGWKSILSKYQKIKLWKTSITGQIADKNYLEYQTNLKTVKKWNGWLKSQNVLISVTWIFNIRWEVGYSIKKWWYINWKVVSCNRIWYTVEQRNFLLKYFGLKGKNNKQWEKMRKVVRKKIEDDVIITQTWYPVGKCKIVLRKFEYTVIKCDIWLKTVVIYARRNIQDLRKY